MIQWATVLPLEILVAALSINYWGLDTKYTGVWITVMFLAIIFVNVFGVLGYAEEEFWVAILKLGTVVVFMIMAFIFVLGGGPSSGQYTVHIRTANSRLIELCST